jgi:hypothetical protein
VLDSKLILSDLNDLGESIIRFIENSNRPIGTLFGLGTEPEAVLLLPNHIVDMEFR